MSAVVIPFPSHLWKLTFKAQFPLSIWTDPGVQTVFVKACGISTAVERARQMVPAGMMLVGAVRI